MKRLVGIAAVLTVAVAPNTASGAWAPDPMFSGDGLVTTDFGNPFDVARAVAVQADGKVVAAGETNPARFPSPPAPGDFAVVRYNADGTLDPTFGGDGMATVDFGGADRGWAVAIQPDGRIVLAGQTITDHDIALARLTPSGALDPTFSGDGRVTTDLGRESWAYAVEVLPDGKILAGGSIFDATASGPGREDFLLARYDADGSLDATFGSADGQGAPAGIAVTDFGRDASGESIAMLGARPVLAGYVGNPADDVAVARYTASGAPDTAFSEDGKVVTDLGGSPEFARGVAVDGDEIVVAGAASGRGLFIRYRFDGSLAPGFGSGGVETTVRPGIATDVAIQPDSKIVAPADGLGALRLNRDGTRDESFGSAGLVEPTFGVALVPLAVALDRSGRIVVAGNATTGPDQDDFAAARLARPLVEVDDDPPFVRFRVDEVQDLGRKIRLRPRCPREPCRIRITGFLVTKASPRKRFRLARVTDELAPTDRVSVSVAIPRRGRRAAAKALSHDGTARARLKLHAEDEAGNRTIKRSRVKLTR